MKRIILLTALTAVCVFGESLMLSGSVVSDNQKMISSRYMGFVKKIYVSEGQYVKKGEGLYTIDSKEIDSAKSQVDLAIGQAELAVQMNLNQYNNVMTNLSRYKRLYDKGMVSKYEMENMELGAKNTKDMLEIAKKQLQQAKEKRKEVMNQYAYLQLKAPNNGVVIKKSINEGDIAIPGMPAIILTDLTDLKIETEIAESDLKLIKQGKKVIVEIPSIGYRTEGEVFAVVPSSNPMTHQFKIKVTFKHADVTVYPGMYAQVYID